MIQVFLTSSIIIFIIFWTFWWLNKFFFHHKWNEAWLLVINRYIRFVSKITKQSKIWNFMKLENIRKISKFHKIIVQTLVLPPLKWKFCQHLPKTPEKNHTNLIFPVVRYITGKLEFVPNILWIIAGLTQRHKYK